MISPHLLPMELYVPRIASVSIHLVFLILTVCYASLFPCLLCLNEQYEYCKTTGSTCGDMIFKYPVGVGKPGCGHPSFQIACLQNSTPVIAIDGQYYTILKFYQNNNSFVIIKGKKCQFLDDPLNITSEFADTAFKLMSKFEWPLYVYKCNAPDELVIGEEGHLWNCNATVHYSLIEHSSLPVCSLTVGTVNVQVGITKWVSNDTGRHESCKSCQEKFGGICGYGTPDLSAPFRCYCREDKCPSQGKKAPNGIPIGLSVGAAVFIAAALLVGIIWSRRRKSECFRESLVGCNVRDDEDMEPGVEERIGNLPIFSYKVLQQATNYFDEKNQLGDGGFGSVYLGKLPDGRPVAVKRLYQDNSRRVEQFINEVQILSRFYHPNLVILYGCTSPESRDLLLVYEYVPNGTLADHLHGERRKKGKGLNWDTRLKICIQTAEALAFLHSLEPPVFHRDVKSSNILLDEHFRVKVADFGLSRFLPLDATHLSTAPQGTPGYIDPAYHLCFQLTDKSDVYSFGVVLMEIISAKIAVDINRTRREIVLATMAVAKVQAGSLHELVDPNLDIDRNPDTKVMVSAVAELGFRCLAPDKEDRPNMKEIVAQLKQIKPNGGKCKDPAFQPPSPTSVQEKWPSARTTPENSSILV